VSRERDWRGEFRRRFARLTTVAVVRHPWLWGAFRGPLRRQWNRIAPTWEWRFGREALAPLEAALSRVERADHALDLGTGTGKAARLVAERFPEATVVGVDLSPEMIDQARALLPPELADRVRFEVGDAAALPFPDGAFDLVVLLNMIPFFPELARITEPGGTLALAFVGGSGTPIYVPPATLRERLTAVGFGSFEELAAGQGTALVARRAPA
jgi:SAM-dependent methyltransferase